MSGSFAGGWLERRPSGREDPLPGVIVIKPSRASLRTVAGVAPASPASRTSSIDLTGLELQQPGKDRSAAWRAGFFENRLRFSHLWSLRRTCWV